MKFRVMATSIVLVLLTTTSILGQTVPTSAKIDVQPIDLTPPDRFLVPSVFEPVRRVTLIALSESILRSQDAKAGATVKEGQEVAVLDRTEATIRLKIAQAEVKEATALVNSLDSTSSQGVIAAAHLEGAQARAELAQLDLNRMSIRAPFSGLIVNSALSDGQCVTKGMVIGELADVSSLRVLLPLNRAKAVSGSTVSLVFDGNPITGKIQAVVPLPEAFAVLHELATPFTGAWVVVANTDGKLESGQRIRSPDLPSKSLAALPAKALIQGADKTGPTSVQVIRNEYVVNVEVEVLGSLVGETKQVTGPFRPNDQLIVTTSVPLAVGTLVRFPDSSAPLEGTSPNPNVAGDTAEITLPRGGRAAPIGPPGSALPKTAGTKKMAKRPPAANTPDPRQSPMPKAEAAPF